MKTQLSFAALVACALFSAGCNEAPAPTPPPAKPAAHSEGDGHDHASEQAHAEHGPHGGDLVELGKEEYHAEFTHDEDSGKVTIYILDGEAKKAVPITATEVIINVKHDGKGEQFKLAAAPQEGDGEGKSSRFTSDDKELVQDIGHEARLVVEINGKSFTGEIKHEEHGDDKDHKHEKK